MDTTLLKARTYRRMFLYFLRISTTVWIIFTLASCMKPTTSAPRILKNGDAINGMVVTTGVADAPPLEAYCNFEVDEDVTSTIDCQVPPLPKLAIGHMIGVTGRAWQGLDWSKLDWQVYLDGYRLDLDSFGELSIVEPEIRSAPSPVREVFMQRKTWDVVLVNPSFGMHTLLCTAKAKAVVYNWAVNFMIDSTGGPGDMVDRPAMEIPEDQNALGKMEAVELNLMNRSN